MIVNFSCLKIKYIYPQITRLVESLSAFNTVQWNRKGQNKVICCPLGVNIY